MKITYEQLQGKSRILQSLTGLNQQEFERLLISFEQVWEPEFDKAMPHRQTKALTVFEQQISVIEMSYSPRYCQ